jgi:hypothetical protein
MATITVCIKDIRDEDWRYVKSEAAKRGMKIGEFVNCLIQSDQEARKTKKRAED